MLHERCAEALLQGACERLIRSGAVEACCIVAVGDPDPRTGCAGPEAGEAAGALRQMVARNDLPPCVLRAMQEPEVARNDPALTCAGCSANGGCAMGRDFLTLRLEHDGVVAGTMLVWLPAGTTADSEEMSLLRDSAGDLASALRDIERDEQRRRGEEESEIAIAYFRLVNSCRSTHDLVESSVHFFHEWLPFEAVGIRLQEGPDFPYYETQGFSDEFVRLERSLCRRDASGAVVLDGQLHPALDCMCGHVIRGRCDPSKPFFTPAGSFWSNATTRLLATTTEQDRLGRTRNRCNGEGYESVGLFALRSGDLTLGLLQLNDRRPDRFTPERLAMIERLAAHLAVALAKTRADEALVENEQRNRAIYDHLPSATFVWQSRPEGFVLASCNEAARAVTNGGAARFVGHAAVDVPHGFPHLVDDLGRCLRLRSTIHRELDLEATGDRSSRRRLVATYGFVPPDMVLLHAEDVTEQRQTEEQLRVVQRMEAIGRLAGGVAHDFNNMLSVILSYTAFAIDGLMEADPLRADLLEIRKAGERAATLTRQLLAFSRKQLLEPQILDLNAVVGGMEAMLRRLLGEDVDLATTLADDLGNVMADVGQMEQVVMNLAVNARDAMPDGGRLAIETANVDLDEAYAHKHVGVTPGRYVMLAVADSGCGMDEQTRARLFEPFFTTKESGRGTGLGLAMVYGVVSQSGGTVWVDSEPARGTTFRVYLPRARSATETSVRVARAPTRTSGTETILLVEDEAAVRNLVRRMLSAAGYTVLPAASGGEALLACERQAPELLLTDVVMPKMSGKELYDRLAQVRPTLRVLYMSGYTDNAIAHHGVLSPGTHFIAKPFNAADLCRKVREILDERPDRAPRKP